MISNRTSLGRVGGVCVISTLLFGLVVSMGVSFVIAGYQSSESTNPSGSYGELLAAAIRELFVGQQDTGAVDKMVEVRRNAIRDGKLTANEDPFPGLLAARLVKSAMEGTLFVQDGDEVSLRITWDMGDRENVYWYLASVSMLEHDGSKQLTDGPWILWKRLGAWVTPSGPDDKPWISDYRISEVSHGDVVVFDLFCLPRDYVDIVERLDPVAAIEDDTARLVLRLPLPVIVAGN